MPDEELRKFLGLEETQEKWAGRVNDKDPVNLWNTDTRGGSGQLFELRTMAYDALKSIEAICDYLGIELKEDNSDGLGIFRLKAVKKV